MPPSEKVLKETKRWLSQAAEDIRYGKYGLTANPPFLKGACYNAQQCAEKSLKAFLVYHGIKFEKTHDLRLLTELAMPMLDSNDLTTLKKSVELTKYVVIARYPTDVDISIEHSQKAIEIADQIYNLLSKKLTLNLA